MLNKIPTYEECKAVCDYHGSLVFYETQIVVDNYIICMFNYRLATYNNLTKPLPNNDLSARELRGNCYVLDNQGNVLSSYIMLNKFWNLNENIETQYDNIITNYHIKAIHNKEDGSMVRFIRLPNNKILSKTKGSIDNEICIESNKIYNSNKAIRQFIDWSLDNSIALIFEFVSPFNKIVLDYNETKLILLKARNNETGEYIDTSSLMFEFNRYSYNSNIHTYVMDSSIDYYEQYGSIEQLVELAKTITGVEGWVINLVNKRTNEDYFIKLKTKWYFERHKLLTEDVVREDFIISKILDETIDDILCQLTDQDIEVKNKIDNIDKVIKVYISNKTIEVKSLLDEYYKFNDIKEFAIQYNNDINFHHIMNIINKKLSIFETITLELRKRTYKLNDAIKFIKTGKI
jgi:T4 RnlA family RNA ligase